MTDHWFENLNSGIKSTEFNITNLNIQLQNVLKKETIIIAEIENKDKFVILLTILPSWQIRNNPKKSQDEKLETSKLGF